MDGDLKNTNCRLCLSAVNENCGKAIERSTRDIFEILTMKLNLDEDTRYLMCNECSKKLTAAFDFKSICLHTEDIIAFYTDLEELSSVDLKDIYLKENGDDHSEDMKSVKVCRLCMQLITGEYKGFYSVDEDIMLSRYIPEVNLPVVEDPVICKSCIDNVSIHSSFIKNCLDVDEKIRSTFMDKVAVKTECDVSLDDYIKTEEIDIKSEETGDVETGNCTIKDENVEIEDCGHFQNWVDPAVLFENQNGSQSLEEAKCSKSDHRTLNTDNKSHDSHQLHYKAGCGKDRLPRQFTYKDVYKRNNGGYQTNSKQLLKHQSVYKTVSEMHVYKCNTHQLTHKKMSDAKVYKYSECNHRSKYQSKIRQHQKKHKRLREVQVYKCSECDYQTKVKGSLKIHQLTHKPMFEVQVYKCKECDYQTKYSNDLKRHQLTHKSMSEVQLYKCKECDYQTKYKAYIKTHQLTHRSMSEVQVYKCSECDYQTKVKGSLRIHQLTHKPRFKVQVYKCSECDYQTKYNSDLKRHQLTHKSMSEVQLYRCNECDLQTKYQSNFRRHQKKHKSTCG